MRVYRSKQNWVPRKLFSLEPGKLVLCICNDQQLACYPSLPYCHLHPPTPQKTGSKKYFKSQAETWKMSCLSVWIKVCVSVSPVFFDNIAQVLCSDFNGPSDVGNLISGSSAFSKTSLNFKVSKNITPCFQFKPLTIKSK